MAAKGNTFPWQRLKALEEHIEKRKEEFTKKFFGEILSMKHIAFMSDGLIVVMHNEQTCEDYYRIINGKDFKRWLSGY